MRATLPFLLLCSLGCAADGDEPKVRHAGRDDSGRPLSPDGEPRSDTGAPVDGDSGGLSTDSGREADRWRSVLYPEDWAPGFGVDFEGHWAHLQDYSYAGYRAGEADLPARALDSAHSVADYGADPAGVEDSTAAIQAAIDAASLEASGTVHLPAGTYRVDGLLTVRHSGVVLAGDGSDLTRVYFTAGSGMTDINHLQFSGAMEPGPGLALVTDIAAGDTRIPLERVEDLRVGDEVGVGMVITDDFREEHEMAEDDRWGFALGQRRTLFKRTVVDIDDTVVPPVVTIDVPVRYPMKVRDGADLRREEGAITECGVMGLSVSTAVDWAAAWSNDRSHAIGFKDVRDCWVRDVASWAGPAGDGVHHLQSGGILVARSRRVTIADSSLAQAQNRGGGGNGYLFEIMQSDEILVRDSVGRAGRHNFIQNWDFGTTGCVFLRTLSADGEAWGDEGGLWRPMGSSEYHHALAMANLVDSSEAHDGWAAKNRMHWSSGAGHSATQSVFWNTRGTGLLESLQYGLGYVIGTTDLRVRTEVLDVFDSKGTSPEDWVEGLDEADTLWPPSLYEDQLLRRIGG